MAIVAESVTVEIRLRAVAQSAQAARRFVAHHLNSDRFDAPYLVDDMTLMVSELVTNAAVHTDSELITVALSRCDNTLRLTVHDTSSTRPEQVADGQEQRENGRGLLLVSMLATRWGSDIESDGKTVWAETVC